MKTYSAITIGCLWVCLLLAANTAIAQKPIKLKDFKLQLKLPKGWGTDSFGGEDWDDYGSSVCECAGVICGEEYFIDKGLRMVIYPAKEAQKDSPKRNKVWDYEWNTEKAQNAEKITTKHLQFTQKQSTWQNTEMEVIQLRATHKTITYIVYVWSEDPDKPLKSYPQSLIQQLINGIEPI